MHVMNISNFRYWERGGRGGGGELSNILRRHSINSIFLTNHRHTYSITIVLAYICTYSLILLVLRLLILLVLLQTVNVHTFPLCMRDTYDTINFGGTVEKPGITLRCMFCASCFNIVLLFVRTVAMQFNKLLIVPQLCRFCRQAEREYVVDLRLFNVALCAPNHAQLLDSQFTCMFKQNN